MHTVRLIGWLLLLLAILVLGRDIVAWYTGGTFAFIPIGQFWSILDPRGPSFVEGMVEQFPMPGVWVEAFETLLALWVAPSFAIAGGVLLWLGRPHKDPTDRKRARQKLTRFPF